MVVILRNTTKCFIQWCLLFLITSTPFFLIRQSHLLEEVEAQITQGKSAILTDFMTSPHGKRNKDNVPDSGSQNTIPQQQLLQQQRQGDEASSKSSNNIRTFTCSISANRTATLPQIPNFIIAGAQKSGTTALQQFLSEHPNVRVSTSKEPHFFDWYYPSDKLRNEWLVKHNLSQMTTDSELQCSLQESYFREHFAANFTTNPREEKTLYFEKTPSYLFLTDVPKRIHNTLPWGVKIIVLLRNPVDRAYSHFQMSIRTFGKSFEALIEEEVKSLNMVGLNHAPSLSAFLKSGSTDQYAAVVEDDPRFSIEHMSNLESQSRHWKHYRRMFTNNYLQRGMYILQLRHWREHFDDNHLLVVQYERFLEQPKTVFFEILDFLGLPRFVPNFERRHNSKEYKPLSKKTRAYLNALFRPYNSLLADELGEQWRDVWA